MNKLTKGIVRVNYSEYHKYFTSTGTTLLIISYLAIFGYLTTTYSFLGKSKLSHLLFLIIPGVIGLFMGTYGLILWKENHENQADYWNQEFREQKAKASMTEAQAELMEERAERVSNGEIEIGDVDIYMEDWE
jgi:hypothetical protein